MSQPSEFLDNLRAVETSLQRIDDTIAALKADLKTARETREKLVGQLRSGVREGRCLPLLELPEPPDAPEVDGLDGLD
jgi:hypothetical protein